MCFFRLSFLYVAASWPFSRFLFSMHPFHALLTPPFFENGCFLVHAPFFVCGSFTVLFMPPFSHTATLRDVHPLSPPPLFPGGLSALSRKKKNNILWRAEGEGGNLERKRNKKNVCLLMVGGERITLSTTYFVFQIIPSSTELFLLFHHNGGTQAQKLQCSFCSKQDLITLVHNNIPVKYQDRLVVPVTTGFRRKDTIRILCKKRNQRYHSFFFF